MCIGYVTVINLTEAEKQFLYLLRCHINNEKLPDGYQFDVGRVFSLAMIHNVLPSIYEIASQTETDLSMIKMSAIRLFCNQISKNTSFREFYNRLMAEGIDVIILKGPVCSVCYEKPDYRLSSDFDIVVEESQRKKLHDFLISDGFEAGKSSYSNPETGLYIEVSATLSEGDGVIKKMADIAFDGFRSRCVTVDSYKTLGFTENLVYLVYHAFKHFVGSGFGVRQLVDIGLFIKNFRNEIDFELADKTISEMGIKTFYDNLIICFNKYFCDDALLDIDEDNEYICADEFISDLLTAGVFGKSSEDRLHSANLVMNAVQNNKKSGVLGSLFPSYEIMKNKFKLLERFPFLLPFFWLLRIFDYIFKSIGKNKKVSPAKSIEIANSRIGLMKKMNIIEQ